MKKLIFSALFCTLGAALAYAQPKAFKYSAVAVGANGAPITAPVAIRFSLLEDSGAVQIQYREVHTTTPNPNGKFNLNVGRGTPQIGQFANLDWAENQYWLRVELSENGGGSFDKYGEDQLLSVPYALYAAQAGNNPADNDNDPANEIQVLSLSGDSLSLSKGGGSVTIPTGTDAQILSLNGNNLSISNGNAVTLPADTDAQTLSLNNDILTISNGNSVTFPPDKDMQNLSLAGNLLSISNGNAVTLPAEVDGSVTNELQQLGLSGNELSISNGNTITLPAEADGSVTNELQQLGLSGNTLSLSNGGGSVDLPLGTDAQTLSVMGNNLSISNGNTVALPAEADGSVTNELQQLGLSGNTLSLSNGGGSVDLPLGTDAQTLSVMGNNLSISNGNTVALPAEVDGSVTNELQQLGLSGNTLSLSNGGGSVDLPLGTDAQTLSVMGNNLSISNGNTVALPAEADGSVTNELQQLGLSGNTLSLSNGGGSVDLPLGTDAQTLSVMGNNLSISNGNTVALPAEADGSVTNEIQQLGLAGNTLTLSNGGGSVDLPLGTDAQTLSVMGNNLSISNGNTVALPAEADGSVTNEIQQLGLSGNTLTLSNGGGSVNLPADSDAQTLSINGNQLSIANGNTIGLPGVAQGAGISIQVSNNVSTITARSDTAMWNAEKIRGRKIGGMEPNQPGLFIFDPTQGQGGEYDFSDVTTSDMVVGADNVVEVQGLRRKKIGGMEPNQPSLFIFDPTQGQNGEYDFSDVTNSDLKVGADNVAEVQGLRRKKIGGMEPNQPSLFIFDPTQGQNGEYDFSDVTTSDMVVGADNVVEVQGLRRKKIGGMEPNQPSVFIYDPGQAQGGGYDYANADNSDIAVADGANNTKVLRVAKIQDLPVDLSGGALEDMVLTCVDDGNGGLQFECRPPNGLQVNGLTNFLSKFNSSNSITESIMYEHPVTGNIGIDVSSPTRARFEVFRNTLNGTTLGIFGAGEAGISLQQNYPTIGFNQYRDGATNNTSRYMDNGLAMNMYLNPSTGLMTVESFANGLKNNSTPAGNAILGINHDGRVSIGTNFIQNFALHVQQFSSNDYGLNLQNFDTNNHYEIWTGDNGNLNFHKNGSLNGYLSAGGLWTTSDIRLKTDWQSPGNILKKVKQLNVGTYRYSADTNRKTYFGFSAQELREWFPELVDENEPRPGEQAILAVHYGGVAVVAIKAVQEQQQIIETQKKDLDALNNRVERLEKQLEEMKALLKTAIEKN